MNMRFNAEAAKAATRLYDERRQEEMNRAAEAKVLEIEECIEHEAKDGLHLFVTCIEERWLAERVSEIIRQNGFDVSTYGDGKTIHIEW